MAKESGIAKSIGDQKEEDMKAADQLLYNYLRHGHNSRFIIFILPSSHQVPSIYFIDFGFIFSVLQL